MLDKPCELIVVIPPPLQAAWASNLAAALRRFKPAALILPGPPSQSGLHLLHDARSHDLAVLLTGSLDDIAHHSAAGAYWPVPQNDIAEARRGLGSAAIVGAACGHSRHSAMEAAEAGADFIAFDGMTVDTLEQAARLTAWWDEITGVPSALACGHLRPGRDVLFKARPDFLLIEEQATALESLTFATELGLQSQT